MKLLDVLTAPWAVQPEKLMEIQDIYARHLKGPKIDIKTIEANNGTSLNNNDQGYDVVNGVAVIPVQGVIAKKMNLFSKISGGASTELIGRDFQQALADSSASAIILNIDSPGGTVDGTAELGNMIYDARGIKPVIAYANGLMASAAYWIGSAADSIFSSSITTQVGSIGVVTRHTDYSKAEEKAGIKTTHIYSGKYKVAGSPYGPLSAGDKNIIQNELDYLYSIFVETVAKHRGVSVETVLSDMADGQMFIGQQAVSVNLVDGIMTLDDLIATLSNGNIPMSQPAGALNDGEKDVLITVLETEEANLAKTEEESAEMSDIKVTKGYVLDNHPDIADAFREEGKASIDVDAIKNEASKGERERIQSVMAQSMPGHESLIETLAFDGKTTGPEAAVQILQAEKGKVKKIADDLHADGNDLANIESGATSENVTELGADLAGEQKHKACWDKDQSIRADFGTFEAYLSYIEAEEAAAVAKRRAE